jgi:hypothetical protein
MAITQNKCAPPDILYYLSGLEFLPPMTVRTAERNLIPFAKNVMPQFMSLEKPGSTTTIHCKKKVNGGFPVLSRDVTYQTLPGREQLNYSRPGRAFFIVLNQRSGIPEKGQL